MMAAVCAAEPKYSLHTHIRPVQAQYMRAAGWMFACTYIYGAHSKARAASDLSVCLHTSFLRQRRERREEIMQSEPSEAEKETATLEWIGRSRIT